MSPVESDDKGIAIGYSGGDSCFPERAQRESRFEFHCDPEIDFEIRDVDEPETCLYVFQIYTKKICSFLPSSTVTQKSPEVRSSKTSFSFFGLLYYAVVLFIMFNVFSVLRAKMMNPTCSMRQAVPFYDFYRQKYVRTKFALGY